MLHPSTISCFHVPFFYVLLKMSPTQRRLVDGFIAINGGDSCKHFPVLHQDTVEVQVITAQSMKVAFFWVVAPL
jgi:hypothetical protein